MYILNPLPLRVRDFFVSVLNRKVTSYTSLRNSIPVLLGSFLKEVYYGVHRKGVITLIHSCTNSVALTGKAKKKPWKIWKQWSRSFWKK